MTLLQFACPHCQGVFQVDESMGGQTVACPHCQGHVQVAGDNPPPSDTAAPSTGSSPPAHSSAADRDGGRFPEPPSFPGQVVPPRPSAESQPAHDAAPQRSALSQPSPSSVVPPRPDAAQRSPEEAAGSTRAKFEVVCGKCTGTFRSNPAMVGQTVLCPYCNARLTVPEGGGRAALADAGRSAPTAPVVTPQSEATATEAGRAIIIDRPVEPLPDASTTSADVKPGEAATETKKKEASIFKPAEGDEVVDPELAVKDAGTRLVKVGDQYVEIRRLSPEEKAARRFKRNVIMVVLAAVVLGGVIFFLVQR